jgi:site-specific DNA-methyltransferase (adenine-specific)
VSRVEVIGDATLYLGDAIPTLSVLKDAEIGAVVSDPPYPNSAGHFEDGILTARLAVRSLCLKAGHGLVFWTEMEVPDAGLPHVATHIWHRTNSNRPDNYEPIFEFHRDGRKRASRVYPFGVIYPGMTGVEASGHPTEKHPGLMRCLVSRTKGLVVDPFMGSGTTGVACVQMQRPFVGCEINPQWFDVACRRIENAYRQPHLFEELKVVQPSLLDDAA